MDTFNPKDIREWRLPSTPATYFFVTIEGDRPLSVGYPLDVEHDVVRAPRSNLRTETTEGVG